MISKSKRLVTALSLALLLGGVGCSTTGQVPKESSPKVASAVEADKPKPVMRTVNAVAVWPYNRQLLISTNEYDEAGVFSLDLSDPYPLDDPDPDDGSSRIHPIFPTRVNSIVVSPDQKWVAMDETQGSDPICVVLFSRDTTLPFAVFQGPMDYASLAFLDGGKNLAMASYSETFLVDLVQGGIVDKSSLSKDYYGFGTRIIRDSQGLILEASSQKANEYYDLVTKKKLAIPGSKRQEDAELCFRYNGKWFAFSNGDIHDLATDRLVFSEPGGSSSVKLSPDGKVLIFRSPADDADNRKFVIVDLATWSVLHRLKPDSSIATQDFGFLTPDVLVNPSDITQFWNIRTGKTIARMVAWADTEYTVAGGLEAKRRDWVIALPDGRFYGSEAAETLLPDLKKRDVKVLREFREALGIKEETE